jgi:pimeloyl-ACP methyl ester carboxylesterase
MTKTYFAAFDAGESAAIEQMIDFYGGTGTFAGWPQRVRDYAVETTAVNILDWASAYGFRLSRALLATIETPTLVLWGGTSHPAVQRANELVGECIPNASVATIDGAAHFLITTHANQVADTLAAHVARVERMGKLAASFSS